MFTVKDNNLEYALNHIKSAEISTSVNDLPDLSMLVVNRENNPGYDILNEESLIIVDGMEWRVKVVNERPNYKNITAVHSFIDLKDAPFDAFYENTTMSLQSALELVINGTGFAFILEDADYDILLRDFGNEDKWECFKKIIQQAETEYIVKGNVVHIGKNLTINRGKQLRYAHNIATLGKASDSTNIVTHVIVKYGDGLTEQETFVSPTASNYDKEYYKIITDERIELLETAEARAKREFSDVKITYDVNVAQGETDVELGETIYTIYEPLNNLELETRIRNIKQKWNGFEFLVDSITVGNYIFQTADEMIEDRIRESSNNTLDESNKALKKTEKEITARLEDTVEYIDVELGEVVTQFNADLLITAQQLRLEFEAETTAINGDITTLQNDVSTVTQTAASIQSTVSSQQLIINDQGSRLTAAESSITQNANNIELKVSTSDYTGANIISRINLDSSSATIQAEKINLVGAVIVDGEISGSSSITVNTDLYVGNNIYLGTSSSATKNLVLNGQAIISGTSAGLISLSGMNLDMTDPVGINIGNIGSSTQFLGQVIMPTSNNIGYTAATTNGLSLSHSSATNRLYVSVGGSQVGFVTLT